MIRINKAGYIYILVTIVIGFSAVNTGNNLVYIVTAALLSTMIVSGVFGARNLRGIHVSLGLPREIFAGSDFPVTVTVRGEGKRGPTFLVSVAVMGRELIFPHVGRGKPEEQSVQIRFDSRGRHRVDAIGISSPFPFNLFTRYRQFHPRISLIVYPKPIPCTHIPVHELKNRRRNDHFRSMPGHDGDMVSIRDYAAGDPIKTINWKATAKTGILKTRELSDLDDRDLVIDLDRIQDHDLEHTLSCMTHLVLKLARSRAPLVVILNGERLQPGALPSHKARVLTKLALYHET